MFEGRLERFGGAGQISGGGLTFRRNVIDGWTQNPLFPQSSQLYSYEPLTTPSKLDVDTLGFIGCNGLDTPECFHVLALAHPDRIAAMLKDLGT